MGNSKYTRSAAVERAICKAWVNYLAEHNIPGDATRSAGSRGMFDVKLNAVVNSRQVVIGVQVKTGTKPTKALIRDVTIKGWNKKGCIGIVAWKPLRRNIAWFSASPFDTLEAIRANNNTVDIRECVLERTGEITWL